MEREDDPSGPATGVGRIRLAAAPVQPSEPPDVPASEQDEQPDGSSLVQAIQTYSPREILRQKDFAELSGPDLEAIRRLMAELVWNLGERATRRRRAGQGRQFDLRRSLRRSLRYGGEMMDWARRRPKLKPRPLVILADVSGSMDRYTRLLLHFVYSLSGGLTQSVEAFVFSTRLTRITRDLRGRNVERALHRVSQRVPDWSGGTRIGEALRDFNYRWARRVLGRGAVVLIISDGWDRGDVDLLTREMARLQRSCHRLIWLNPLLGEPKYEPLTRGLRACLRFVDDFLPAHNLVSLEDLGAFLSELDERRPVRRQQGYAALTPARSPAG